jgi:hypothetical protein
MLRLLDQAAPGLLQNSARGLTALSLLTRIGLEIDAQERRNWRAVFFLGA